MIINSKFFHHPPYVSTTWKQVAAIHSSENNLILNLHNGDLIKIPDLSLEEKNAIFNAHADFLQKETATPTLPMTPKNFPPFPPSLAEAFMSAGTLPEASFQFGIANADGFASALQHNQAQANMPDLPHEILEKIGAIAKIIAPHDVQELPKAEPHCNCMHCQIARAIHQGVDDHPIAVTDESEPVVSDEELAFQDWDIQLKGNAMYQVTDKQDLSKSFVVYLGEPMGCTCGQQGCEHLIAVLKGCD